MSLTNHPAGFGLITRVLHWVMAIGLIGMLGFGTYLVNMTVNMSNLHFYAWHKSIGLALLVLAVIRLQWHQVSRPPAPLPSDAAWQDKLAKVSHRALYVLMFAVPLTGWIASSATGIDVLFFGLPLPRIAPVSEAWEDGFFTAHAILTKLLLALIVLHIAGGVKRGAPTLRRIVRGS